MIDLYEEVREIIDEWDPLNFYPDNRYGVETMELIRHLRYSNKPITIESINYLINYLLNHGMYDPDKCFNKTKEETLEVSKKLFDVFK